MMANIKFHIAMGVLQAVSDIFAKFELSCDPNQVLSTDSSTPSIKKWLTPLLHQTVVLS